MQQTTFDSIAILIPAYKPQNELVDVVSGLIAAGFRNVVVVNDGSGTDFSPIFEKVKVSGATVVEHSKNQGKGEALRTGFRYIQVNYKQCSSIITCDADGQHRVPDITSVAASALTDPKTLWMGSRSFSSDIDVPLRSRMGNIITSKLLGALTGLRLKDTQTGLRAIPINFVDTLLRLKSARYEFEMEMLLVAAQAKVPIREVSISTVYIEGNQSSHFNPLIDSFKIYFILLRFVFSSLASAALDTALFALLFWLTNSVPFSMVIARIVSGTFNFFLGRNFVFKSSGNRLREFVSYWLLALFILSASTFAVYEMQQEGINVYYGKIAFETFLFIVSFIIQRNLVYKKRDEAG